jgi:acyl dehydratase
MLPEEVTKFIGKTVGTSTFQVEREAIRRFADSIGDYNPLYWDQDYAKKSRYGSIIAPPGLICAPWYNNRRVAWGGKDPGAEEIIPGPNMAKAGYGRILDGGVEWEFLHPVKAGDTITAEMKIKDVFEREGKSGKMAFTIRETTYTNQNGKVVAKARGTAVHPEG